MRLVTKKVQFEKSQRTAVRCSLPNCDRLTKGCKPFCLKHILLCDYAKMLSGRVNASNDEISSVKQRGIKAVNMKGLVVEEILIGLAELGEVTWRRLIKDRVTFLPQSEIGVGEMYLSRLYREGLIKIRYNDRKNAIVALTLNGFKAIEGLKE